MKIGRTIAFGTASLAVALGVAGVQAAGLGDWGPVKGDWEFTLGGNGTSNSDFGTNTGGFNASVGYFLTDAFEVAVRQTLTFTAGGDVNNDAVGGATYAALDYHFRAGQKLRPFVGVTFGGIYGDFVNDSLAAGLEGGLKYYVKPKTFIFGTFGWNWLFDDGDSLTNNFDDGSFVYTAGVGFHF